MKIESVSEHKSLLSNVPVSSCFYWDKKLWIKVKPRPNERTNAVALERGDCWYLMEDTYVTPAEAKVVIE